MVFTTASIGIALSSIGYSRAEELLRDSPLAVALGQYVVMPDRLSSPMKKWFTECVDYADTETMGRVSRALRIIQDL